MQFKFDFNMFLVGGHTVVTCILKNKKPPENKEKVLFAKGASICMPGDEFIGEVGRRKALARAIQHLPRKERKEIFQGYEVTK